MSTSTRVSDNERVPEPIVFEYTKPDMERPKKVVRLARTDIARVDVQVVREGGENNLHSHRNQDGVWYVLGGAARFYTADDREVATIGAGSGVVIPRGYPYWFESVGEQDLEILHLTAIDPRAGGDDGDRVDHEPMTDRFRAIVES